MKTVSPTRSLVYRAAGRDSGFTLVEIMISMAILSLVIIAVVYSHILGLKMFSITATKLTASQYARTALNRVRDDVRTAKRVYVGNADKKGFVSVTGNRPREGNALQIFPGTSTNYYVWYSVDPVAQNLRRVTSTHRVEVLASFITNELAFAAEDFGGNLLTNDQNNRVIRMSLDFYQWEFPVARLGGKYDFYHLQTRMTRRALE